MVRDFLDLHFRLESGVKLTRFTRFEGPITFAIIGQPTPFFTYDFNALRKRLKTEAEIELQQAAEDQQASITLQMVSRRQIQRILPDAACFVAPNVSSLSEYRRKRHSPETSWRALEHRTRLTIFVPNDVSPQEQRDCLHEELAQALGPLNDLYRLPDSVFNDDNVHSVLTSFDMLMLRATYAPQLHTGMSRAQVAQRIPTILARLNPRGAQIPSAALPETPRDWIDAVEQAIGSGHTLSQQIQAANKVASIAKDLNWQDHRRAFGHFLLGRAAQFDAPDKAYAHFESGLRYLPATPLYAAQRALVETRLTALDITRQDPERALKRIPFAIETAQHDQNAALLATSMLLKAQALEQIGEHQDAAALRRDSLGAARYGFGSEWVVRSRLRDIAALSPNT